MVRRGAAAVAGAALVAACSNGSPREPTDGGGRWGDGDVVSVDELEDQVGDLPGVVDVDAERTEADSEYWVVGAEVVVADEVSTAQLSEIIRVLGEAAPLVDGSSFTGSVRLARDAPRDDDPGTSVLRVRDQDPDPELRASGFLTAVDAYPEALVDVDGGVLSITGLDPRGDRVTQVLGRIAAHPVLSRFVSTVVGVEDAVEGLPSTEVWVDEPLTDRAVAQWQAVVDVVATAPPTAAASHAYVLVRNGVLDHVEVLVDGDLPDDVAPDFATWNPVLGPMIQQLLLLGAANADPGGTEIDVNSPAGEFAGVSITDAAAPSDYGDPVWCQWAADVVNGSF